MFPTFAGRVVIVGAAIPAAAVLFSFLAPWLPVADSVAHFRLHLASAMAAAAILLVVLREWRPAGIAGAVATAGFLGLSPAMAIPGTAVHAGPPASITLVQLNLSFRNTALDSVAALVREQKADVVTLQEVNRDTRAVIESLGDDYRQVVLCPFAGVGGVAVLSRLELAPGESSGCADGEGMAWLRVMIEGRAVSVATLHLHWPYPFRQARQIDALEPRLRKIPRPILLAGDFNAAPWSHAAARIADATETTIAGGLRPSFSIRFGGWVPSITLPIDHVLLPNGMVVQDIRLGPGPGSDHASIVARLGFVSGP